MLLLNEKGHWIGCTRHSIAELAYVSQRMFWSSRSMCLRAILSVLLFRSSA